MVSMVVVVLVAFVAFDFLLFIVFVLLRVDKNGPRGPYPFFFVLEKRIETDPDRARRKSGDRRGGRGGLNNDGRDWGGWQ